MRANPIVRRVGLPAQVNCRTVVKEAGMGDSQVTIDGESPFDSWPTMSSPGRVTPPAAPGANWPTPRRAERFEEDRTRVDIPVLSASAGGPEMTRDPQPT